MIKVIKDEERVAGPVNDRFIVIFPAQRGNGFQEIVQRHKDIIEGISPAKKLSLWHIKRTIYLNRPDSLNEEDINWYVNGYNALLAEFQRVQFSIELFLHQFSKSVS